MGLYYLKPWITVAWIWCMSRLILWADGPGWEYRFLSGMALFFACVIGTIQVICFLAQMIAFWPYDDFVNAIWWRWTRWTLRKRR